MPIASGVPQKIVLYQDNTQDLSIYGLVDAAGVFVNNAVLTATLLDSMRNADSVLNATTFVFVTGSNGDYVATVSGNFSPSVGTEYTTVIDGDAGSSHIHLEICTEIRVRQS